MAPIDSLSLIEHVVGFGGSWVRGAVGVNVGADVGEEVGAVSGVGDGGC